MIFSYITYLDLEDHQNAELGMYIVLLYQEYIELTLN